MTETIPLTARGRAALRRSTVDQTTECLILFPRAGDDVKPRGEERVDLPGVPRAGDAVVLGEEDEWWVDRVAWVPYAEDGPNVWVFLRADRYQR